MKRAQKLRVVSLVLCMVFLAAAVDVSETLAAGRRDESLRKGETRPTLDPNQFSDPRVKAAYEAAKEIPWILDSIYCYCMCKESPAFHHKSLLSCYVDKHASY